jgi:mRNA-degrading endonuclease RelE of RelBE toxin-antitoxin system
VTSNRFRRDLHRLDAGTHRRVIEALEQLRDDPQRGSRLTTIRLGRWSMRVGEYRLRDDLEGNRLLLDRVRHRGDIYRESHPSGEASASLNST